MSNEDWIVSPIDEHRHMIEETNTNFVSLTRLLDRGVLSYSDYSKHVSSTANNLIEYLKEERRAST